MEAAGWTVVSYGPSVRLRALLSRRRPVSQAVMTEAQVVARLHVPAVAQRWSR
jgi:hypothetical protein